MPDVPYREALEWLADAEGRTVKVTVELRSGDPEGPAPPIRMQGTLGPLEMHDFRDHGEAWVPIGPQPVTSATGVRLNALEVTSAKTHLGVLQVVVGGLDMRFLTVDERG